MSYDMDRTCLNLNIVLKRRPVTTQPACKA